MPGLLRKNRIPAAKPVSRFPLFLLLRRLRRPFRSPAPPEKPNRGPSRPAPTTGGVSLSGRSILSLLNTSRPAAPVSGDADPAENPENLPDADEAVEEDVESRLQQGCELLTRELFAERPRLGIAFQDVSIRENRILLKVPNESLYDEVTNHLTDIRKRLCDLGDVPLGD